MKEWGERRGKWGIWTWAYSRGSYWTLLPCLAESFFASTLNLWSPGTDIPDQSFRCQPLFCPFRMFFSPTASGFWHKRHVRSYTADPSFPSPDKAWKGQLTTYLVGQEEVSQAFPSSVIVSEGNTGLLLSFFYSYPLNHYHGDPLGAGCLFLFSLLNLFLCELENTSPSHSFISFRRIREAFSREAIDLLLLLPFVFFRQEKTKK